MVRSAGSRPRGEPSQVAGSQKTRAPSRSGDPVSEQFWGGERTTRREALAPARAATREARLGLVASILIFIALAGAVVAFAGGWPQGRLVLDGPGVEIYVRLALDFMRNDGYIPFWLSAFWGGSPAWALAPAAGVFGVLPFAQIFGAEQGVIVAMLVGQIVGAWGAYVLARSLWGSGPAPALAGLFYGLSPIFVSHTALFGHQTPGWVYASMPWFVWCLRLTLRRGGARWIAASALITAFAVLQQAEHAYGLALLGIAVVFAEILRTRDSVPRRDAVRAILVRGSAVVGLGLALIAHWLLPLGVLKNSFALNPPEELRFTLGPSGIGGLLGATPSAFLTRPKPLSGAIGFFSVDLIHDGAFYLGGVLVALTFVTAILLVRNEREGATLGAILLASTFAVWMSTALTPLAEGDLSGTLPSVAFGVLAGLFAGGLLQRMRVFSRGIALATVVTLAVAVPYVAPFGVLRDYVPLLADVRFPRMYPIAMLGLALGGAYPVHVAGRWLSSRPGAIRESAPALTLALALVLATAFLIDVWPMNSYYRLERPSVAGYLDLPSDIRAQQASGRVAVQHYPDSRVDLALLESGWENATGWPHPTAGAEMWRLTAASWLYPPGLREQALGLAGASVLFFDDGDDSTPPAVSRNPFSLPLVRAYRDLVVVEDPHLATDLSIELAFRNVGVVTGDADLARHLEVDGRQVDFVAAGACSRDRLDGRAPVVAAVARSCSRHPWMPNLAPPDSTRLGSATGAVFHSPAPDLRAVDVSIGGGALPDGQLDLTLRELESDGATLGPVVRQVSARASTDRTLTRFAFDPVAESAGRTYAFTVRCADCTAAEPPLLGTLEPLEGEGNLVVRGRVDPGRVALFALDFGDAPAAPSTPSTLRYTRPGPGKWSVQVSVPEPTLVVVAEGNFPGWSAQVDGQPVQVLHGDGAFLAVEVGPGDHTVTLQYDAPSALAMGFLVSGGALALAVAMLVVPARFRRRRIRPAAPPPPGAPPTGSGGSGVDAPDG